MFNFGLFATHIPYIIFAFAYMIYFGVNILDHPETLANPENSIIYINSGYPANTQQSTYYYSESLNEKSCNNNYFIALLELFKHSKAHIQKLRFPLENEVNMYHVFLVSNCISRPPPTC